MRTHRGGDGDLALAGSIGHGPGINVPVRRAPDGRCGFGVDGVAYCWSTIDGFLNAPVVSQGGTAFRSIATGQGDACGVLANDGSVVCWGRNDVGQLGNGTTIASNVQLPVAGPANP